MEEIYEIGRFFPNGTSDDLLNLYVEHHVASVTSCVDNELYSSAYAHLHLLYMAFIYIQLLRIAREKEKEFEYGWIGFPGQEKDFLKDPRSPFSFAGVNEKSVFRFFRLVGFNDPDIANISSVVVVRNDRMHASGTLHCADAEAFSKDLQAYMSRMRLVVEKQRLFLKNIYLELLETYDQDYEFTADDLESNFQDQYFLSEYELLTISRGMQDNISRFIEQQYA